MTIPSTTREYAVTKIGSYESLEIREVQIPKLRGYDVLVKVHAVSLQYRDLIIAKGQYSQNLPNGLVPCSDMAGEVLAVGEHVTTWKKGDRVCANFATEHLYGDTTPEIQRSALGGGSSPGVLTQYRSFLAHSLVAIPDHFSYEEASTLPCAAVTAYNALNGAVPVKAGDYVLTLGTGGVSIFGLQLAVAAGAIVISTSSSDEKLKKAKALGAKHLINYKTTPDWDAEILKITNGRGVDHVLEVGGGTLEKSINASRIGGHIHIIGFVASAGAPRSLIFPLLSRAISLRGIQIGSVAQFIDMNRLIYANPTVTKPFIDKVFPFEKAIEAYAYLESQKHVGKVVIKVAE